MKVGKYDNVTVTVYISGKGDVVCQDPWDVFSEASEAYRNTLAPAAWDYEDETLLELVGGNLSDYYKQLDELSEFWSDETYDEVRHSLFEFAADALGKVDGPEIITNICSKFNEFSRFFKVEFEEFETVKGLKLDIYGDVMND